MYGMYMFVCMFVSARSSSSLCVCGLYLYNTYMQAGMYVLYRYSCMYVCCVRVCVCVCVCVCMHRMYVFVFVCVRFCVCLCVRACVWCTCSYIS